jgi:hypothetical protein
VPIVVPRDTDDRTPQTIKPVVIFLLPVVVVERNHHRHHHCRRDGSGSGDGCGVCPMMIVCAGPKEAQHTHTLDSPTDMDNTYRLRRAHSLVVVEQIYMIIDLVYKHWIQPSKFSFVVKSDRLECSIVLPFANICIYQFTNVYIENAGTPHPPHKSTRGYSSVLDFLYSIGVRVILPDVFVGALSR